MSIFADVEAIIRYAGERGLISPLDHTYVQNRIIDILHIDEFEKEEPSEEKTLSELLLSMCEFAAEKGIIGRTQTEFDLFDTRIMGELCPKPSETISRFCEMYLESPECATDWFYEFSKDTNYIRRDRMKRDMKWKTETEYGTLDITINLSKPEKSPDEIARLGKMKKSGYPACPLCRESEGYSGRADFPARENHRVMPIEICGELWQFQYSPYVYYNEHCIALNNEHVPMCVHDRVFDNLFSFLDAFPHYFIGSNAGLPIVGGSILSHEHFQGGRYTFAMEMAEEEKYYKVPGYEDVSVSRVRWPMAAVRMRCEDRGRLSSLASRILEKWKNYTDENVGIFAETNGGLHNTITPIARLRDNQYELDVVFRNNITSEEHPDGVFHPHKEHHHIKKENIGLIEVMGLAVLPPRLKRETELLCKCADEGRPFDFYEETKKHAAWAESIMANKKDGENTEEFFLREIGKVFLNCLFDASVFKRDEKGLLAFDRFMKTI